MSCRDSAPDSSCLEWERCSVRCGDRQPGSFGRVFPHSVIYQAAFYQAWKLRASHFPVIFTTYTWRKEDGHTTLNFNPRKPH